MSLPVTEIVGTICNADGSIFVGARVSATIRSTKNDQGGQVVDQAGVTSTAIEAFSDETGSFSFCILSGAVVLMEIPSINLRKEVSIPLSGPVDFTTII